MDIIDSFGNKVLNQEVCSGLASKIAVLLLVILLLILLRNRNLHSLAEARKAQNESLMQSLQQKSKLLELARPFRTRRSARKCKTSPTRWVLTQSSPNGSWRLRTS